MIITMLQGGMGNQMFQYAAGLALANRHRTALKLDIHYLLDTSRRYFRYTPRPYALDVFNITAAIASPSEISMFTVPRVGNKYLYHLRKRFVKNRNVFRESELPTEDDFFRIPSDAYLEGYWQRPTYFHHIRELLRREFSFREPLPEFCLPMWETIKNSNAVCVVFRRGDYVGHPQLDILDLDYYHAAINWYRAKNEAMTYFVFSDDIPWCQANFSPKGISIQFVDQQYTGPKAQYYLQLMMACKHYIIPNSTYPWWAAWLNDHPGKTVIAPRKWFKDQTTERNPIVPDTWITL